MVSGIQGSSTPPLLLRQQEKHCRSDETASAGASKLVRHPLCDTSDREQSRMGPAPRRWGSHPLKSCRMRQQETKKTVCLVNNSPLWCPTLQFPVSQPQTQTLPPTGLNLISVNIGDSGDRLTHHQWKSPQRSYFKHVCAFVYFFLTG